MFQAWSTLLPDDIEICPVQLPGRENRLREKPFKAFPPLVEALAEGLAPYLTRPFAFFGHSMGAMVSFELTRLLRRRGAPQPEHLFVSAYRAPQILPPEPLLHTISDSALINALIRLDTKNRAVLENDELRQFLLPIIRADFTACETYTYRAEEPLSCSITAFGGLQDNRVNQAELDAWRLQTSRSFTLHMLPGGHFYLNSLEGTLFKILADGLRPHIF